MHRQGKLTDAQFEEAFEAAYAPRVTTAQLDAASVLLDAVWKKDVTRWPRRLSTKALAPPNGGSPT